MLSYVALMKSTLSRYLKNLAVIAFVFYLLICALLYLFQEKVLFHPQPRSLRETAFFLSTHGNFDTLPMRMADGTNIMLYLSKDSGANRQPLILYFGGNAEDVAHVAHYQAYLPDCRLALINYRGYGLSQGFPTEQNMFGDALEVYDKLHKLTGAAPAQTIVVGRSIGTGVATYLSSKRPVGGTVLITPYESMTAVAQDHYPLLPVSLLLKHRFESERYAMAVRSPVLALVAANDRVIPPEHAQALMRCWNGTQRIVTLNADHNTILDMAETWKAIDEFAATMP